MLKSPWLLWHLWKARNLLVFENRTLTEQEVLLRVATDARNWSAAQEFNSSSSTLVMSYRCFSDKSDDQQPPPSPDQQPPPSPDDVLAQLADDELMDPFFVPLPEELFPGGGYGYVLPRSPKNFDNSMGPKGIKSGVVDPYGSSGGYQNGYGGGSGGYQNGYGGGYQNGYGGGFGGYQNGYGGGSGGYPVGGSPNGYSGGSGGYQNGYGGGSPNGYSGSGCASCSRCGCSGWGWSGDSKCPGCGCCGGYPPAR